jgi:hypothetical protein
MLAGQFARLQRMRMAPSGGFLLVVVMAGMAMPVNVPVTAIVRVGVVMRMVLMLMMFLTLCP